MVEKIAGILNNGKNRADLSRSHINFPLPLARRVDHYRYQILLFDREYRVNERS